MLTGKVSGKPNVGQRPSLGFEGVEIGIGRARLASVGLARFALAGRGHVVDVLERAPQALRPLLCPDHDVQADERDVAFRTDDMSSRERLGDVDDIGVLDDIIARSHRRRVRRIERAPCGFDRDRAYGQFRRVGRIGQVLAQTPAMNRQRRIFGFVEAPFVAGIGPILRHQRISADAWQEGGLVEIHEGREGRERLCAIVDIRSARVRRFIGRPGFWRDRAPVGTDLEQFIARLEGLPDAGPLIAEHLRAVGFAAMSGIGQRGPIERDKGSPGEIVEVGIGVGLDRRRVLDAIGRNRWARYRWRRPGGRGEARSELRERRSRRTLASRTSS